MKTTFSKLFLLFVAAFLFAMNQSCENDHAEEHNHTEHTNHDDHDAHDHDHDHDHVSDGVDKLTLNDGQKWEADEPTNKNVEMLVSIGKEFSNDADKSLEDYNKFGSDVIDAINVMIKECTMEGAADQALHYWFLPIMNNANSLKDATDIAGLDDVASETIGRMNVYQDYFE